MHLGLLTCIEEADLFIYFNMLLKIQQTLPQSFFPICAVSDGSYLTSSGTAYWVDQKGRCCPWECYRCLSGFPKLINWVCSKQHPSSFADDVRLHTVCWCVSLLAGLSLNQTLVSANESVKRYSRIVFYIVLLYIRTGMPITL